MFINVFRVDALAACDIIYINLVNKRMFAIIIAIIIIAVLIHFRTSTFYKHSVMVVFSLENFH